MKIIYLFIYFITFFIIPIICQPSFNPIDFKNNETQIIFKWNLSDIYYKKWIITRPDNTTTLEVPFTCVDSETIKTCTYTNTGTPSIKEIYGISVNVCFDNNTIEDCSNPLNPNHYPTPIITSLINPSPNGGSLLLTGAFIKFVTLPIYFQLSSGGKANIVDDTTVMEFDPTKVTVNMPKGCGTDYFNWTHASSLAFNYSTPTITSGMVQLDEENLEYVHLEGTNFCNVLSLETSTIFITVKGQPTPIEDVTVVNSTFIKFKLNYNYSSSNVEIIVKSGSTGPQSNTFSIIAPPFIASSNSVPSTVGGIVTLKGRRLISEKENSKITVIINFLTCEIISTSTDMVKCSVPNSYTGQFPLDYSVDGIHAKEFIFTFDNPSFFVPVNNTFQNGKRITLYGECFGSDTSILKINDEFIITNFTISPNQSVLSFDLSGKFYGPTKVGITVGGFSVDVTITPLLFIEPASQIRTIGSDKMAFYFYYLNEFSSTPIINIILYNGTIFSANCDNDNNLANDPTDGWIPYFVVKFPPLCGTHNISFKTDTQEFNSTISSGELEFPNSNDACILVGDQTVCNTLDDRGNTGGQYFKDQVVIKFENETIIPTSFFANDTKFSFDTKDIFSSGTIVYSSCGRITNISNNLKPLYLSNSATGFENDGGDIIITGRYFTSETVFTIDCNGKTNATCIRTNFTSIKCNVALKGPFDQQCHLSLAGSTTVINVPVYVSFHEPIALSIKKLPLEGGKLIVYGRYFYEDSFHSISVGDLPCTDFEVINSNFIYCNLPKQPKSPESFDKLIYINITMGNKSGGGYVFIYSRPVIISSIPNNINPMIPITIVVIIVGVFSVYLQLAYVLYNNKDRKKVVVEDKRQLRRQLTQPQFQFPKPRTSSINSRY